MLSLCADHMSSKNVNTSSAKNTPWARDINRQPTGHRPRQQREASQDTRVTAGTQAGAQPGPQPGHRRNKPGHPPGHHGDKKGGRRNKTHIRRKPRPPTPQNAINFSRTHDTNMKRDFPIGETHSKTHSPNLRLWGGGAEPRPFAREPADQPPTSAGAPHKRPFGISARISKRAPLPACGPPWATPRSSLTREVPELPPPPPNRKGHLTAPDPTTRPGCAYQSSWFSLSHTASFWRREVSPKARRIFSKCKPSRRRQPTAQRLKRAMTKRAPDIAPAAECVKHIA